MCHILLGKVAIQIRDVEAEFCRPIFHIIWQSENAEQLSRCNLPLPYRRWSPSSLIVKQPDAILTSGQDMLMLLCAFYCKLCLCWFLTKDMYDKFQAKELCWFYTSLWPCVSLFLYHVYKRSTLKCNIFLGMVVLSNNLMHQ